MRDASQGGLAGKARRAHHRSRAGRLCAQQQIADYLDPNPEPAELRDSRPIPIGHRREFVASVAPEPVHRPDQQLELPLTRAEPIAEGTIRITRKPLPVSKAGGAGGTNGQTVRQAAASRTRPTRSRETFSLWRFLGGCAMGSAAAAMILLIVQVTLR